MNLATVRLFLEVAEAGSISKVAVRRQTVQSHISRQMTEFETQCGSPLFRRTGRGVVLTEHGERVQSRLRLWLQDTERVMEEMRADSGQVLGEVRLGILPSSAHPLVTRLFQRLRDRHPGIRLNITEGQGVVLDTLLDSGALDLAILFRFQPPGSADEKLLCVVHTYLVSAPGAPLTRGPTVDFAELEGLDLVLPRRPSQWRNALDETARSLGFRLGAVAQADSLTVQRELVAHTPGIYSILGPFTMVADLKAGRLQASKLINPDLSRHVTLALPKHGKLTPACRVVAAEIQDLVVSWGNQLTEPSATEWPFAPGGLLPGG